MAIGKGAPATKTFFLDIRPQMSTVNKQPIRDHQRNMHFSAWLRSRKMNINVNGLANQNYVVMNIQQCQSLVQVLSSLSPSPSPLCAAPQASCIIPTVCV